MKDDLHWFGVFGIFSSYTYHDRSRVQIPPMNSTMNISRYRNFLCYLKASPRMTGVDTPELDAANVDKIWMTGLKTKVCLMIPPTGDARKGWEWIINTNN